MKKLELSESLIIGNLENDIYHHYKSNAYSNPILLDFSYVSFIDLPSMIFLLSFIYDRDKKNFQTIILLPRKKKVRDILRRYRFPIMLKYLTGKQFRNFVKHEDYRFFGETVKLEEDFYKEIGINETSYKRLLENGFFSLNSLPFANEEDKNNVVDEEYLRWNDELISSIFEKHLKNYSDSEKKIIPNEIVMESVTNAIKHPKANFLINGSYFDKNGKHFTLSYWDNGISIIETLKEAIDKGKKLRSDAYEEFSDDTKKIINSTYYFKVISGKKEKIKIYNSDMTLTPDLSEAEILLSSFFPGVTRDQFIHQKNPKISLQSTFNNPGMGLPSLLNATIDRLAGQISVRVNNYFINIKNPTYTVKKELSRLPSKFENLYQAKVIEFPDTSPFFLGNMITIRLDLK